MPLYTSNFNSVGIKDVSTEFFLKLLADSNSEFSEDRGLTIAIPDSDLTLTISSNVALDQNLTTSSSPSFNSILANILNITNGGSIRTGQNAGNSLILEARDVDGASWTTFATLTANNTPTFNLAAATTLGGQIISSGTYTPTITNVTNVAASTVQDAQWLRIGNNITVSGRCTIDPTSASVATEFALSFPVASTTGLFAYVGGACNCSNAVSISVGIEADITNNRAAFRYINTAELNSKIFNYVYTYSIH